MANSSRGSQSRVTSLGFARILWLLVLIPDSPLIINVYCVQSGVKSNRATRIQVSEPWFLIRCQKSCTSTYLRPPFLWEPLPIAHFWDTPSYLLTSNITRFNEDLILTIFYAGSLSLVDTTWTTGWLGCWTGSMVLISSSVLRHSLQDIEWYSVLVTWSSTKTRWSDRGVRRPSNSCVVTTHLVQTLYRHTRHLCSVV